MNFLKRYIFKRLKNVKRTDEDVMKSEKFKYPYITKEDFIENFRLFTVTRDKDTKKHIIFYHGGGYVLEPLIQHRNVVKKFCDLGFKVTYVDYPLAPEYNAEKTVEIAVKACKKIIENYKGDTFYLFGDSAGGGLAVTVLLQLRDEGFKNIPKKTILASPWLDLSMSNKELKIQEKKDILFSIETLFHVAKIYAGNINLKDKRLSPIYDDLNNLGSILMFYSEKEIFKPDCEIFIKKINACENSSIIAYAEKKAIHDYILCTNTKKSKAAFRKMKKFLLNH